MNYIKFHVSTDLLAFVNFLEYLLLLYDNVDEESKFISNS